MAKMSAFLVALFFAGVSLAYAAASAQPAATGAASVEKAELGNHSNGKANQGLDTAETHIADTHGKATAERADHAAKAARPTRPERPAR